MSAAQPESAPPPIDTNQLSLDRTRLAYERTLLAWVRTATGLITFGFSIYKFFQIHQEATGGPVVERLIGPREFAIVAILLGLAALVLATIEHNANLRALRASKGRLPVSLAGVFGALISLFGLFGLVLAILRQ